MSGLVAQFPVAAFTTPNNGDDLDAAVVVSHDNTTATAHSSHDADGTIHFQSSTLATRPGAATAGRKWITTDGLRVYYDTGSVWSEIAYLALVGGTVTGATTFSAGIISTTGTFSGLLTANLGLTVTGAVVNVTSTFGVKFGAVDAGIFSNGANQLFFGDYATGAKGLTVNVTTGAATFSGAVSAGALTATTGTFAGAVGGITTLGVSGLITSTKDGQQYLRTGASTIAQYFDVANTGGRLQLGVESSAGGAIITGSTAYATILTSVGVTPLQLGTNQTPALTISGSTQAVTLLSLLNIAGTGLRDAAGFGFFSSAGTGFVGDYVGAPARNIQIVIATGAVTIPGTLTLGSTLAMGGALSGVTTLAMSSTLTGATRVESGKFKGNSGTPTSTNGPAIGTGGSVGVVVTGTDTAGKVLIIAGTTTLTTGVLCTITFNSPYASVPFVLLHFDNKNTPTVLAYGVSNVGTNSFDIQTPVAPTVGQQYLFYYAVIQ